MRFIVAVLCFHFAFAVYSGHCPEFKFNEDSTLDIKIPKGWHKTKLIKISYTYLALKMAEANGKVNGFKRISCHYRDGSRFGELVITSDKFHGAPTNMDRWRMRENGKLICEPKLNRVQDCPFGPAVESEL